jgi:hypothetical protein
MQMFGNKIQMLWIHPKERMEQSSIVRQVAGSTTCTSRTNGKGYHEKVQQNWLRVGSLTSENYKQYQDKAVPVIKHQAVR